MISREWSEKYSVNIGEIDEQHKKLLDLISKLDAAICSDSEQDVIFKVFSELVEYTDYHFLTEENLMRNHNFPKLEEHKNSHKKLMIQTVEIAKGIRSGEEGIQREELSGLLNKLIIHIQLEDIIYGEYMNMKGVD